MASQSLATEGNEALVGVAEPQRKDTRATDGACLISRQGIEDAFSADDKS